MTGKEKSFDRYPYTHCGPPVHGSKLADYMVSELALREDYPELFKADRPTDAVEPKET